MRVLFTTWAWPSHYFPMVPVAWALRAAGHDVRVASQPALADTIAGSGLPAVVTGRDFDMVAVHRNELASVRVAERSPDAPRGWDDDKRRSVQRTFRNFATIAELMIDDLLAFARAWGPDLVVFDPLTYAGPLVADITGVPAVRSLFGPDFTYETRDVEAEVVMPLARRFGRDSVDTVGALTLDPCPPSLQFAAPIRRQRMRYVPYSSFSVVPDWLLEPPARRRICISWGTTTTKFSAAHSARLPEVVAALSGLDAEVVLASTADQVRLFPQIPAHVRVADGVPLNALLPTCDAIIHHGGAGTTLTAALHAVPQLMVVQTPDQIVNAVPLANSGAGCYLIPDEADRAAVAALTTRLLDEPAYRQAAQHVRSEMHALPPPAAAVDVLLRLARGDLARDHGMQLDGAALLPAGR